MSDKEIVPMKPARFIRPTIEFSDPDDFGFEPEEPELEFTNYAFECRPSDSVAVHVDAITMMLNDGWQIEDKIICPPHIIVFFSRVKEDAVNE